MRHKDFSTTERFDGGTRATESAAAEIYERLATANKKSGLVGGLVGGAKKGPPLAAEELRKRKSMLNHP